MKHIVNGQVFDHDNCSRIENGHPWTQFDTELFSDLAADEQAKVREWIRVNITTPGKKRSIKYNSYGLKHILERDIGVYMTNNQFKDIMLEFGYYPINEKVLNWMYRLGRDSEFLKIEKEFYRRQSHV